MTSEGGGWTLVARQIPSLGLTDTTLDINTGLGWNENSTFRYGNNKIQQYSPTQAWRITSVDGSGTLVDNAWFSPSCVIDWGEYVGIWGSSTVFNSDCGIAYTSSSFTTVVGGNYTTNACSLGIGQNNNGNYCSIRMGSCSYGAVTQGMASPCSVSNATTYTMSLWVK